MTALTTHSALGTGSFPSQCCREFHVRSRTCSFGGLQLCQLIPPAPYYYLTLTWLWSCLTARQGTILQKCPEKEQPKHSSNISLSPRMFWLLKLQPEPSKQLTSCCRLPSLMYTLAKFVTINAHNSWCVVSWNEQHTISTVKILQHPTQNSPHLLL